MDEQNAAVEETAVVEETAAVEETVVTAIAVKHPYRASNIRFDEEEYMEMTVEDKLDYLTKLVNHSSKYESFWNISFPLDVSASVINEITSSFLLFPDKKSKEPLTLYKSDISSSGKSWVLVYSSYKNESVAVFKRA